jgi:hypothetical protein
MTKQEILKVLYKMEIDFMKFPVSERCVKGFCRWISTEYTIVSLYEDLIIEELKKDKVSNIPSLFWYESFVENKNYEASIQTRLDHLNRTIERLENELKTEQNGTIQ